MSNPVSAVLLVEGDPSTRELYVRELGRFYRVFTAALDQDVLLLLRQEAIQAIVLEPATFGQQGWQLLARIRAMPEGRAIPVVLCSILDERRQGLELGVASYLLKPVVPSVLLRALQEVVPTDEQNLPGRANQVSRPPDLAGNANSGQMV